MRGAIPLAAEQFDVLLRVIRSARPRVKRILDLGCGDGVLGRILMEAYPGARGVFVDFSEPMLEPGGVFLNLEHVAPRSDWGESLFDEYFTDALHAHHVRTGGGRSRQEIIDAYVNRADKAAR